jgi:hypothetical protein
MTRIGSDFDDPEIGLNALVLWLPRLVISGHLSGFFLPKRRST